MNKLVYLTKGSEETLNIYQVYEETAIEVLTGKYDEYLSIDEKFLSQVVKHISFDTDETSSYIDGKFDKKYESFEELREFIKKYNLDPDVFDGEERYDDDDYEFIMHHVSDSRCHLDWEGDLTRSGKELLNKLLKDNS